MKVAAVLSCLFMTLATNSVAREIDSYIYRHFGVVGMEKRIGSGGVSRWDRIFRNHSQNLQGQQNCLAQSAWCRWQQLLSSLRGKEKSEQMSAVNQFVTTVRFISDQNNYGMKDYWATPREFFRRGGDCEDFAIAKYLSLLHLGWRAQDLRLLVGYDMREASDHALLLARVKGRWYVLDNLTNKIAMQRERGQFTPYYALSYRSVVWWDYREHK